MPEITGNTKGIKDYVLEQLKGLYELTATGGELFPAEIVPLICRITAEYNKEISLYIARNGQISDIVIGGNVSVTLPPIAGRRGRRRLSGYRLIHTHPGGDSTLSGVDIATLKQLRLDAMVAIGVNGAEPLRSKVSFALITAIDESEEATVSAYGPLSLEEVLSFNFLNAVGTIERILSKTSSSQSLKEEKERTLLVSLACGNNQSLWTQEDSLEELKQLADTAGAEVIAKIMQKRPKPDPVYFIGKGKVEELGLLVNQELIDLVVFDDDLTPAQQRNLERVLGTKVMDRTGLILDIFAQRARTSDGKLQVELAQLEYRLPRIMGQGLLLSRLGGGIGTRGPGETKLEEDRRKIRERISFIKKQIARLSSVRQVQASSRVKKGVPLVSLVGYTNAGKSTLLNALTDAEVYAEDKLFATLDPTSRQLNLDKYTQCVLSDTVGFVQRLPHQLVAAFKSTLEDVVEADVLLHVVDVSHPLYLEQSDAVYKVLAEIGAADKTVITVYNKIDKLPAEDGLLSRLAQEEEAVLISAKKKLGFPELLVAIAEKLKVRRREVRLHLPFAAMGEVARLHQRATVLSEEYDASGVVLSVSLPEELVRDYEAYIKDEGGEENA